VTPQPGQYPNLIIKTCKKCEVPQPTENYWKQSKSSDGLQPYCKTCQHTCNTKWNSDNPDRVRACSRQVQKTIRKEHPERFTYRKRKESNPEAHRRRAEYIAFHKFGVNQQWFDNKLAKQSGKCAICGKSKEHPKWKRFSIDHNHECCGGGKACDKCRRGLLCHSCNIRLGFIENREWIEKAIAYLNSYPLGKPYDISAQTMD